MYDIIIIGAGTAGISAYKEAVKYTQNILIMNDGPWDTTCARVGCMPSKVLISSANRFHDLTHLEEVGLKAHIEKEIDTSNVMSHVRQLRDEFTAATLKDVNHWPEQHKISGKAVFIHPDTVQINNQQYQARSFILAVGSTPSVPAELKQRLKDRLITSDDIFELPTLPESVAVIGSGVIAIELAQALSRLGVKTTIFARSKRIGTLTSPALQELAQQILSAELDIKFEILPDDMSLDQNKVKVSYTESGKKRTQHFDYLLHATGRDSLLSTLNLEQISSQFSDVKKLPIDPDTKQLANLPIFIAGDAHTTTPVQHEAAYEGKMLVHNCLTFPKIENIKKLTPLGIVFCSPEMAIAGKSYKQLKEDDIDFITGYVSYEKQGRAKVLGKNKGATEIYIDPKSRQLLGAEILVEQGEHLAHLLAWMISEQSTIDTILNHPFYHPTLEEGLRTALKHARRQIDQIV
ncbi:dihydrolipoyl dehydrogenase [Acinetobacter baylyi]|uniref:dihydrolipoyl dehydrogenase n=1 Tax=Acinetobacter baylyi TaxID=202950 RepID=UPI000EA39621|nr:dihydrolipoyl dehydrogenase [Acinetobacter baylyi]